jgi:hypothetical protein
MSIKWSTWEEAARLDAWDERDVIYLCTSELPNPNNGSLHRRKRKQSESEQERRQEMERVQRYISRALEVGALEAISQTPFPYPNIDPDTGQPIEDDRILFDPAAFTAWAVKKFPDTFPKKVAERLGPSSTSSAKREPNESASEPTNAQLLAIAGLLELLLAAERPRYTQTSIAQAIEAKEWFGASASALEKLFAKANRAAEEAESGKTPKT